MLVVISCEGDVATVTIHHLRYGEKIVFLAFFIYLIYDFCVYLKCILYGYMISLKCGDEEENSLDHIIYSMDYSTFANSNLLFCRAAVKECWVI